ncbi:EI24 domain-containing protein tank [Tachypleus tridentatus]|uniref:EI24 domain-containing protein tank n=1 Tax=Tachypleus tridentatus TaxID=6853 RepID=UPI003FD2BEDA
MDSIKLIMISMAAGVRDAVLGVSGVLQFERAKCNVKEIQEEDISESSMTTLARRRAQSGKVRSKKENEPNVVYRILQCCALNGGVFWLSILIFYNALLPGLRLLMEVIFGDSTGLASTMWSWMKPILSCTFSCLWVLPLFLLSRIVNGLWFQDIADSAYRYRRGRPQLLPSLSKLVADMLFSVLIQALFLIQSMIVSLLPITPVGELISLIHMCLLYSLYAFEYRWFNMGWELHKRLSFIENNWPYFVGFGLPLALLTSWPSSYIVSGCVFSILFPLLIISGNEATPLTGACERPLQLFSFVVWISNSFFHQTLRPITQKKFCLRAMNLNTQGLQVALLLITVKVLHHLREDILKGVKL